MHLLTINTGSSSLKAALYDLGPAEVRILSGHVDRIGLPASRFRVTAAHGAMLLDRQDDLPNHDAALQAFFAWLKQHDAERGLDGVGHRVVHGGSRYREPQRITAEVVRVLQDLVPLAPDHMPQALAAIETVAQSYPALPQVACFDTAFHRRMPQVAQIYALPRNLREAGVIRYGFHGLSYEYVVGELRRVDTAAAEGRLIIAHLGNGASMAAVRSGASIDTTMGFTPAGGLVMGTRSGDLDPGVLLYLLVQQGLAPSALNDLVNRQAGLLGVSGTSADMHDLLNREAGAGDVRAAEAIELFCYQARKFVGALSATLGGLDTLVFTGGIGENAEVVRARICAGLEFLGIQLDPDRNNAHAPVISRDASPVTVRVMPTDEDLMIARHTYEVVRRQASGVRRQ